MPLPNFSAIRDCENSPQMGKIDFVVGNVESGVGNRRGNVFYTDKIQLVEYAELSLSF